MKNPYLHLIKFDLRSLVLNRITLLQTLFTQIFLAHFFIKQLGGFKSAGPVFWNVYLLAAGFFTLNIVNFFSFEFTFSKVRRFKIAESLFAAPVSCRTWLYSAAAVCVIFNGINLLLHLLVLFCLTGALPLGLSQIPALLTLFLAHAALVLALGLASIKTGFYTGANIAVFILTIVALTAFGFVNGFNFQLSPGLMFRFLASAAAAFAVAAFMAYKLADTENLSSAA